MYHMVVSRSFLLNHPCTLLVPPLLTVQTLDMSCATCAKLRSKGAMGGCWRCKANAKQPEQQLPHQPQQQLPHQPQQQLPHQPQQRLPHQPQQQGLQQPHTPQQLPLPQLPLPQQPQQQRHNQHHLHSGGHATTFQPWQPLVQQPHLQPQPLPPPQQQPPQPQHQLMQQPQKQLSPTQQGAPVSKQPPLANTLNPATAALIEQKRQAKLLIYGECTY